jgi:hypothetical protein
MSKNTPLHEFNMLFIPNCYFTILKKYHIALSSSLHFLIANSRRARGTRLAATLTARGGRTLNKGKVVAHAKRQLP